MCLLVEEMDVTSKNLVLTFLTNMVKYLPIILD
jgi:hypothetical protein